MAWKGKSFSIWYHGDAGGAHGVCPTVAQRVDSVMLQAELSYLQVYDELTTQDVKILTLLWGHMRGFVGALPR